MQRSAGFARSNAAPTKRCRSKKLSTSLVGSARCADRERRIAACLSKPEQREHSAGASFFDAVGIVKIDMTSGADAAVMNCVYALRAALFDNFRGEIDFVMRWTNAGAQLHNQVARLRSEVCAHLRDRIRDNAQLGPFAAGMDETDGRRFWIDNINRATIGDMNAEQNFALVCDDSVATGELLARFN